MSDESLVRYHDIKGPDSKEREILKLLQQPGVHEKVQGIAATLANCFNAQTKLLVDINIGATFKDIHDNMDYIYEGVYVPYDFDPLTTVIMREAQHPLEELSDRAYATFRQKQTAGSGERFMCSMRDFVKMFAIKRWQLVDANNSEQKNVANRHFR